MKNKLLRNIIIAVAAIGILLGMYFWAVKWEPAQEAEPEATETAQIVVLEMNDEDIVSLDITNEKGSYTIKRVDDGFTIVGLENANLTSASLGSPFSNLKKLTAKRIIKENADNLEDYGLDAPAASVTAHLSDGSTALLKIGDKAPTDDGYYAMTGDSDKVYLISTYYGDYYFKGAEEYKNTNIGTLDMTSVKKFELYKGNERITEIHEKTDSDILPHAVNETLVMSYPYVEYVSGQKFSKLFEGISAITARKIVEDTTENASRYGIGAYTYKITDASGDHVIKLGNTDENGDVYAVYEGNNSIFTMDSSLLKIASDFRPFEYINKFIQIFNIDDISKVVYSGKSTYELSIDRTDAENIAYTINGQSTEEDKFKKAYQEVIGILFTSASENPGMGAKVGEVTFTFNDGSADTAVYYEYDERNYAVQKSDGTVYIVLKKNFDNVSTNIENIISSSGE
ncbi:MAG: DUF4340 domain-containing protein [Clostridia bacterium]|nr:DUF4340 domain-containing protein [Clostridia bacterium]